MRARDVPRLFLLVVMLVLLFTGPVAALERAAGIPDDDARSWAAGGSATLAYYNLCTGWGWVWSGFEPGDRIGTAFEVPFDFCTALENWVIFRTGAPAGYGFTGSVSLQGADASLCPDGVFYASQPLLPASGWNHLPWGWVATPQDVAFVYTFADGTGNPAGIYTDHPAAGATGPQACGTCYPTTRETRSFHWGRQDSPICPGSPFSDPVCNAELLIDLVVICADYIVPESWAAVKQLYR